MGGDVNRIPVIRVMKNFAELIEDEESGKMKFRSDALTVQTQVHHVKPAGCNQLVHKWS